MQPHVITSSTAIRYKKWNREHKRNAGDSHLEKTYFLGKHLNIQPQKFFMIEKVSRGCVLLRVMESDGLNERE